MNHLAKNRLLIWMVVLLILANVTSIAMFWLGKPKQPEQQINDIHPKGKPQDFLIRELKLDAAQQVKLEAFSKEQREAVNSFKEKVKQAKENFFYILKQQNTSDSVKKNAVAEISNITQQIDLLTLNYFEKVRAICNANQQKKFDEIIKHVIVMMSEQRRTAAPRDPLSIGQEENGQPRNDNPYRPPPPDDEYGGKQPPTKK